MVSGYRLPAASATHFLAVGHWVAEKVLRQQRMCLSFSLAFSIQGFHLVTMSVQLTPAQRQRVLDILVFPLPEGRTVSLRDARRELCQEGIHISHEGLRKLRARGVVSRKRGSGRPRKTTQRQDRALVKEARRQPRAPAAVLQAAALTNLHKSNISRRLKMSGLPCRRVRRKPFISNAARQKRIAWAREHLTWTPRQWVRCIFTDEKDVQLLKPLRNLFRRPTGAAYDERYAVLLGFCSFRPYRPF